MGKNTNIHTIKFKNFNWYNITKNSSQEIEFIKKNLDFDPVNIDDCLPPLQRPKIFKHPNYIFMILLFPYYDRKNHVVRVSEVDFFISTNSLVLVHDNKLSPLIDLQKKFANEIKNTNYTINPTHFLYEILESLLQYCFPMINHIGLDIDDVEEKIFADFGEENVRDILVVKRNIINFRKSMQAHKNVLKRLSQHLTHLTGNDIAFYYDNLIEVTKDIWDMLDNYKETIDALYYSNESLVSLRLNEIMKMLTIISVLTFPLTLFVALFSTNLPNTPLSHHPFGFWIIVGLLLIGASTMLYTFKSKRWF